MARAVTANAGSYAMTDPAVAWPFGLAGLPQGLWQPATVFALPVTVLLGTDDTDPNHHSLPRQPQAMAQDRKSVAQGQGVVESVDHGGRRRIKPKKVESI